MACRACKHWNCKLQGETDEDIETQRKMFGKIIGQCGAINESGYSNCFPMFDYEECGFKISKFEQI